MVWEAGEEGWKQASVAKKERDWKRDCVCVRRGDTKKGLTRWVKWKGMTSMDVHVVVGK